MTDTTHSLLLDISARLSRLEAAILPRASKRLAAPATVDLANRLASRQASHTGISVAEIMGLSRAHRVVAARWSIWADMRAAGVSLSEIAAVWGMDHSTVKHGLRKLEGGK